MVARSTSPSTRAILTVALACVLVLSVAGQGTDRTENVIIRTAKPYDAVVARIEAAGGRIKNQYRYVDAIAAEIPHGSLAAIRAVVGANAIIKDALVPAPAAVNTALKQQGLTRTGDENAIQFASVSALGAADLATVALANPDAYLINNSIMDVNPLHAAGKFGQGIIVALIDSGIRPGFPHISLDGSVIGGDDFVGDGLGFSNGLNEGHGTFVAGMVSANVTFTFAPTSTLLRSARINCPSCVTGTLNNQIPMIGTAPLSSIYALRVFGRTGGAPTSRILQAVERVIELREKYDAGQVGGVNIQVCNMSLGGPTLFAGRDLFDQAVDAMLDKGIVLTVSAGNAGPSSLTGGSPGTAFEALTVGAASTVHNERILRDIQFGVGIGPLYRPFAGTQTAYFSSRGPTADGRVDPDVIANGFANYGQGFGSLPTGQPNVNSISIASGTSFSSPSTAGVAALLRQANPGATARQIRNAIILAANPDILADGSTELDQGDGYVDAAAASSLLVAGVVPDSTIEPRKPTKSVAQNVRRGTFLEPLKGSVQDHVADLKPGQRADFLYEVAEKTDSVTINLSNFTAGAIQNALFGDDILLTVHTAKTSAIGEGDYQFFGFVLGGTVMIIDPEPGLMRVTVNGDFTNAGPISTDVSISSTKSGNSRSTDGARINDGQLLAFEVQVPAGVTDAVFSLRWRNNWSRYPTSDVDLILRDPAGLLNFDGATLDSPERVAVHTPAPGTWTVFVDGFDLPSGTDKVDLRVSFDGKLVK
jgi:subtilisin family serine protease